LIILGFLKKYQRSVNCQELRPDPFIFLPACAAALACTWIEAAKGAIHSCAQGADTKAGHGPHLPTLVRHSPFAGRLRHPHNPDKTGALKP